MSNEVNPQAMEQMATNKSVRVISDVRSRLRNIGDLDANSLQEANRSSMMQAQDGTWDANGNFVPSSTAPIQTRPTEHGIMNQMRPVQLANQNYSPIEVIKERNGKEVSIFQIRESNGSKLDLKFRRKGDADMACAILNETGQINDPRLSRIMQLVNQENQLIKTKSKTISEAKNENNSTRRGLLIERKKTLDMQIENIRIKLGVSG